MKVLFNIVGSIALALAIIGIFLPLLPTTPFLLLASACYLRGSVRMHRWLSDNRLLGPYIKAMENRSGIPRSTKVLVLILLWASMSYSIYIVPLFPIKVLLALIGLGVSAYLLFRIKTLKKHKIQQDR